MWIDKYTFCRKNGVDLCCIYSLNGSLEVFTAKRLLGAYIRHVGQVPVSVVCLMQNYDKSKS